MSTKEDLDNHANQLNCNNDAYWQSRGDEERPADWDDHCCDDDVEYSQADLDNHANQLNQENDEYWQSRGVDGRPDDEM